MGEEEGAMADIFRSYTQTWIDSGSSGSFGLYSTDTFPQGTNVYANTVLAAVRADRADVAHRAFAFIYEWAVYAADGTIFTPANPNGVSQTSAFINNCAKITFGVFTAGGLGEAQMTIFRR
jgi:hypothetical protein